MQLSIQWFLPLTIAMDLPYTDSTKCVVSCEVRLTRVDADLRGFSCVAWPACAVFGTVSWHWKERILQALKASPSKTQQQQQNGSVANRLWKPGPFLGGLSSLVSTRSSYNGVPWICSLSALRVDRVSIKNQNHYYTVYFVGRTHENLDITVPFWTWQPSN